MISWIIMGIVFALIALFAVYILQKNKKDPLAEKRSFLAWLFDIISHIHY